MKRLPAVVGNDKQRERNRRAVMLGHLAGFPAGGAAG